MKKVFVLILIVFLIIRSSLSQPLNPAKWTYDTETVSEYEIDLIFRAAIDKGWHMYGLNMPDGGPYPVSFNYSDTAGFEIPGKPIAVIQPVVKYDNILGMKLETLEGEGLFKHRIKRLTHKEFTVSGFVEYMACNDKTCTPPLEQEFTFIIKEQPAGYDKRSNNLKTTEDPTASVSPSDSYVSACMDSTLTGKTDKDKAV